MTVLDIMLKVADLGLLRSNKDELNKMESYMQQSYGSMGYFYEITPHKIYIIDDEDNYEDITDDVLVDIYGEDLSDY